MLSNNLIFREWILSAGIYRITNLITNEVYVGYSLNLQKRKSHYKGLRVKSQPLISTSLETYGFENHEYHILFDFEEIIPKTRQLKQLETMYIRYYKYWKGCTMLNSNEGGGGSGKWSDEKKRKKSDVRRGFFKKAVLQYDFDGRFIRRWNSILEVSTELSLDYNLLIRCLKGHEMSKSAGGFQWRYDHKNQEKKIGQYDLNGNLIRVWNNSPEYLRSIGKPITSRTIMHVCMGISITRVSKKGGKLETYTPRTAYGYKWKFIEPVLDTDYENIEPYKIDGIIKPILQYDLDGNFIREWNSVVLVKNELGISTTEIYSSLNNRNNKKFSRRKITSQWRYKEGDEIPQKIEKFLGTPVIAQYSLDGKLVRTWDKIAVIQHTTGFTRELITNCIQGKQKSSNGFQWRRLLSGEVQKTIPSIIKEVIVDKTKVLQYGMDGKFIKAWDYIKLASTGTGVDGGAISAAIKGKLKSAGGFQWRVGEIENIENLPPLRIIHQYTRDGVFVREWDSAKNIVKSTGYFQGNISNSITGRKEHAYGFVWKYKI